MAKNKKNKRSSKRFLAVDVWRSEFGPISVKAIHDVYSQKFNVDPQNMNNYSFSKCVDALRKLEDPEYVSPQDSDLY